MAVNLRDDSLAAYQAVVNRESNWCVIFLAFSAAYPFSRLLLAYDPSVQPESFQLYAQGSGIDGLPELKSRIDDPSQVFIAFYRDGNDGFILLNIIPESVSGVRRARALVHSRRIGAIFQVTSSCGPLLPRLTFAQATQTSLTVDHLSNLTPKSIRQVQKLPSPSSHFNLPL